MRLVSSGAEAAAACGSSSGTAPTAAATAGSASSEGGRPGPLGAASAAEPRALLLGPRERAVACCCCCCMGCGKPGTLREAEGARRAMAERDRQAQRATPWVREFEATSAGGGGDNGGGHCLGARHAAGELTRHPRAQAAVGRPPVQPSGVAGCLSARRASQAPARRMSPAATRSSCPQRRCANASPRQRGVGRVCKPCPWELAVPQNAA